jgi:hypothetical protein
VFVIVAKLANSLFRWMLRWDALTTVEADYGSRERYGAGAPRWFYVVTVIPTLYIYAAILTSAALAFGAHFDQRWLFISLALAAVALGHFGLMGPVANALKHAASPTQETAMKAGCALGVGILAAFAILFFFPSLILFPRPDSLQLILQRWL